MADEESREHEPRQGWGSWAASVAATGVGAVTSAARYTLTAGGGVAEEDVAAGTKSAAGALRRLAEVVETVTAAAEPTAGPTAEAMLELVYDLVVPSLHDCLACGLRPPVGWLPGFAGATARRSAWELFMPLPQHAVAAAHDEGYYDSLKKTAGFVHEEIVHWRAEHGLEHETAIPVDGEPDLRGAPHELVVLIAMGLQEGVLGKWLRVVLGDATHVARHYNSDAALVRDSGTVQRLIELAEALDALQLGSVADEDSGGRRIGRMQQGLPTNVEEVLGPALAAYEAEETIRLIRGKPSAELVASDQRIQPRPVVVLLEEDEPITVTRSETDKEVQQQQKEEEDWGCQPCSPPVGSVLEPAPQPAAEPEPEPGLPDVDELTCLPCAPPK